MSGRERGEGEKTLIQDEYNEGKELCKEIKKKKLREKEVLKAHVFVYGRWLGLDGIVTWGRGLAYINNNVCNGLGGPLLSQP